MKRYRRSVSNKWAKHEVMRRHSGLGRYMPETRRMTPDSLYVMLGKYGMVYVKPVKGSLGIGVMRVERKGEGVRLQSGASRRYFPSFNKGYRAIAKAGRGKPYLVQRGIRMMKYRGRSFDIRLMVMRTPRLPWRITGYAGRVAHPRKVVTNGSQGGTIYPLGTILPRSRRLLRTIKRIGLLSARRLQAAYPGLMEIGLDIAIDRRRRPWVLEANTNSDPCPFTKLPDRRMLWNILKYGRASGRKYNLYCVKSRRGV